MVKKSNRRGQVLNLVIGTIIAVVVFIFTVFALLYGMNTVTSSINFGSTNNGTNLSALAVTALQTNTTTMVQNFSQQLPTVGTIFGIVLLLGVLGILIMMILRWKQNSAMSGGGSL